MVTSVQYQGRQPASTTINTRPSRRPIGGQGPGLRRPRPPGARRGAARRLVRFRSRASGQGRRRLGRGWSPTFNITTGNQRQPLRSHNRGTRESDKRDTRKSYQCRIGHHRSTRPSRPGSGLHPRLDKPHSLHRPTIGVGRRGNPSRVQARVQRVIPGRQRRRQVRWSPAFNITPGNHRQPAGRSRGRPPRPRGRPPRVQI